MADENLFNELMAREMSVMAINLTAEASKTAISLEKFIQMRLLSGASPESIEAQLQDDLVNGGRVFGEFRNVLKSTAIGSTNRTRDVAYYSQFETTKKYRWSAVLVNTCPDCMERHNQSKTWDEWEEEGLPRTGATVCREYCHCVLIPDKFVEIDPIKRG